MRSTPVARFALALLITGTQAAMATDEPVSIEVSSPPEQARIAGPTPLIEVSGWGSLGPVVGQDLVLVIDVSGSTLLASGVDVNGNGKIGRTIEWVTPCTDPGDSIRAAEFVAARRVLEAIDTRRTRVGLVVFESSVRKSAPISTSREQLELTLEHSQQRGWGRPFISGRPREARTSPQLYAERCRRWKWIVRDRKTLGERGM